MKSFRRFCLGFFLGGFFALSSTQAHSYTGMVTFGDSLSDLGNTIAMLSPFGESFVRTTTGYNANFYYNGRFSNGPLWSERLYEDLELGTMLRNDGVDIMTGTNFAYAGSTSGSGYTSLLPNLLTQVGFYTTQLGNNNPALPDPASTLYSVWSGGNDVINLVDHGTLITPNQVVQNISTAITNLYDAGGISFLIPNLPPLGYKPDFVFDPVKFQTANEFVDEFNLLLESELNFLMANREGINIIPLDISAIFLDAINDPSAYGLTNVNGTAYTPTSGENPTPPYGSVVGNPDEYLFWDNSHATTAMNVIIMDAAYAAVIPEPGTGILILFSGALFAFIRHRKRPGQCTAPDISA